MQYFHSIINKLSLKEIFKFSKSFWCFTTAENNTDHYLKLKIPEMTKAIFVLFSTSNERNHAFVCLFAGLVHLLPR